jgi:hypothetical protein
VPETLDLDALWQGVNDELHRGELIPALWQAAAAVKPLAIDGDTLILGAPQDKMGLASHLESTRFRRPVESLIEKVAGQKLSCRVIEGDTLEAWERRKVIEDARAAGADASLVRRRERRESVSSWEGLRETLTQKFSELASRRSPRSLAQYLQIVLPLVRETERKLEEQGVELDDADERQLGRVFDKIATQCNIPSTIVALEYLKLDRSE